MSEVYLLWSPDAPTLPALLPLPTPSTSRIRNTPDSIAMRAANTPSVVGFAGGSVFSLSSYSPPQIAIPITLNKPANCHRIKKNTDEFHLYIKYHLV